jgi:hypothetical protein
MLWGFFTVGGSGSLVPVDGMMNSSKYIKILKSRVSPFLQTFARVKGHFNMTLHHATTKKQSRSSFKKTELACSIGVVILRT